MIRNYEHGKIMTAESILFRPSLPAEILKKVLQIEALPSAYCVVSFQTFLKFREYICDEFVISQRPSGAIINNTILMCVIPVVSIPMRNNTIISLYTTFY